MIKPLEITTVPCTCCNGLGTMPDKDTGLVVRRMRKTRGVTLRNLVEHFPYSYTYTNDLENDRRPWNNTLVDRYKQAIEDAVKERLENAT